MAVGGLCQSCKNYSHGLFTCQACGSRICPMCVMPGTRFCVICKGIRQIK